jgi:hypothetical protein
MRRCAYSVFRISYTNKEPLMNKLAEAPNEPFLLTMIMNGVFGKEFNIHDTLSIRLWDQRIVTARLHSCDVLDVDVSTTENLFLNSSPLRPFMDRMLRDGVSFTTETAQDISPCTLHWTIQGSEPVE